MVKPTVDAIDIDPKTGTTLGFYTFGQHRPNLMVISGMNGRSATDVYANYLIMKHLQELSRVDGSITLLPVAAPLAFRLGARVSPLDSKDLDSVFPGDEQGSVTQRLAWEIWRKVSQADHVIQLKIGEQYCLSHAIAMHREYIHVRNLASLIGLPLVVQSLGHRGALSTEAAHEGIPVITIEMRGNRESVEPQAAVEVREAILNFMRNKDMIPGDSIDTSSVFTGRTRQVNVDTEGFFIPSVNLGEEIRSGMTLGVVQDRSEVVSPYDGTVVSLSGMNYIFEGDMVARIATPLIDQTIESEPEVERQPPQAARRKW